MRDPECSSCCADLVLLDGRLLTFDLVHPKAEAMAVLGGRIVSLGTNQDIRKWIGDKTQILNAKGNTILPGFIDSHVHFKDGGFSISRVQLRDAKTPQEFIRRIGQYASQIPHGEWIQGGRWNHELWAGSPLPVKEWIDGCTPDNPVLITRYDGHMALANSRALQIAGFTRNSVNPVGGIIERESDGEPSGLLKDEAIEMVEKVIPDPFESQKTQAIRAALAEARRYGITGIHDNAGADDFAVFQKLFELGELTCRVYCMMPVQLLKPLAQLGIRAAFGNDWIRLGALKAFADGSLGSSTALFFEPYNDSPQNSGLAGPAVLPDGNMPELVREAAHAGLQVCIHAIGDKANHLVLDMYETTAGAGDGQRFRIEHAQHLHADDIRRFASIGVIASMQPVHLVDDGCWAEKRIGYDRSRNAYAFKSLLNSKVRLAFGSDWPVAPLNPLLGIYAAVTRQTLDGKHPDGWFPGEKISFEEAIKAYTIGSAYAEFAEKDKGSLTVGKLADIAVLDADITAISPERYKDVKVLYTIVGGKVVYRFENG